MKKKNLGFAVFFLAVAVIVPGISGFFARSLFLCCRSFFFNSLGGFFSRYIGTGVLIAATGVFNSWLTLATKSRRLASMRACSD